MFKNKLFTAHIKESRSTLCNRKGYGFFCIWAFCVLTALIVYGLEQRVRFIGRTH